MTDTAAPHAQTGVLSERMTALEAAVELADGRLNPDAVAEARAVLERARGRLGHGTHHTVVALAGPTGSGKSSLFNALAGEEISNTGVKRPTTSDTHACVWGDGAGELLDWMQVKQRHHLAVDGSDERARLDGLVLLDLPDFDSTQSEHRMEVDRMIELVDMFVWVVDPQKYADQSLHDGYLRPLAGHASVMRFILSKADTLQPDAVQACLGDFGLRLAEDGIDNAEVVPVSTQGAPGIDAALGLLHDEVTNRRAVVERVEADLVAAGQGLRSGHLDEAGGLSKAERKELVAGLGRAAGVDSAAQVVADQHRRDARLATGWPVTKWFNRLRRNPMAELSTSRGSAVAEAEVSLALREAGEAASDRLGEPWEAILRRVAQDQQDPVLTGLGTVTGRVARSHRDRPAWWSLVQGLQWLLLATAAVGLVWLILLFLVDGLLRIDIEAMTPQIDWMPLPTLLLLGGLVAGLLVAVLSRLPASIGAGRRASRVRRDLLEAIGVVADERVVDPLEASLGARRSIEDHLSTVIDTPGRT